MANLLIVNPSVNMKLAALEMKMYGNLIDFAYTSDIPVSNAKRVFYFLSGVNICFTTEVQGEMEREDSYKDGLTEGRAEMLHQIICTMLSNGRTVSQIAAELKMDEDSIAEIAGEQKENPA